MSLIKAADEKHILSDGNERRSGFRLSVPGCLKYGKGLFQACLRAFLRIWKQVENALTKKFKKFQKST